MHVITDPNAPVKPLTEVERAFAAAKHRLVKAEVNGTEPSRDAEDVVTIGGFTYVRARYAVRIMKCSYQMLWHQARKFGWATMRHPNRPDIRVFRLADLVAG